MSSPEETTDEGRRAFCKLCIGGLSVASAAMIGFPIVAFMERPERLGGNKPLEVSLEQLTPGQAQYVEFHGEQLIVLMMDEPKDTQVFSASCPHLGCNVLWDPGDKIFKCPCHGAMFNSSGQVIRGPVSAPLRKVNATVEGKKVIVS